MQEYDDSIITCSFSSRKARMVPGMTPRTPPPSMLSTVTMLPYAGGGDLGVAHGADVGARRAAAGFRVRPPPAPGSAAFTGAMATASIDQRQATCDLEARESW